MPTHDPQVPGPRDAALVAQRPAGGDSLAAALQQIEDRLPTLADRLKRRFVEYGIPANRTMGIRIVTADRTSEQVELRLLPRRRNLNVAGTIHGGVLLAFAETVHGVAVLWRFPPARHRMVTRHASIRFLAPARGEQRVRFTLGTAETARIEQRLSSTGVADLALHSEVTDAAGVATCRLDAEYRLTRR